MPRRTVGAMRWSGPLRLARLLVLALGQRALVLLLVALGVFALLEIAQGDAADAYLAAAGGGDAGFAAALREEFGLAGPFLARLAGYFGGLARLDLGISLAFGRPVAAVLAERLPVTLLLMGSALVLTAGLGTALGILAAERAGRAADGLVTALALALNATPGFVIGLVAIIVFSVELRWLPIGGLGSFRPPAGALAAALDTARHLVLPVATLTLTYLALYVRVARAALLETARQDFVRTARAKGLSGRRLFWRHRMRPALTPLVTLAGVHAAAMLGGSVVVETVFAVPGFGSLAAMAVAERDTVLLAGVVLCGAVLVVAANAIVDGLCRVIDPRTRADASAPGGATAL